MRVALKLTAVILGILVAVLALEGWLRVRHEREVFEEDIEHEHRLLGTALRPSIETALQTSGRDQAESILERAQHGETEVQGRLISADGVGEEAPLHRRTARAALSRGAVVTLVDRSTEPGVVVTYVPLTNPSGSATVIELSESLAVAEERLDASTVRVFLTALAIVIGAGFLALGLGERIVGQPVRKLVQLSARIASGDLRPPVSKGPRWDELGQLKAAIGTMVEGLANARDRAERETQARLKAEREVRRRERLVAVGTLAAGVAHELGTPLQIVSGRARMIEDERDTSKNSRRNARVVQAQVRRMERIVRQLLSLQRPARVVRAPLSMVSLAHETMQLLRPLADAASVSLEVIEEDDGPVRGDRDHLHQSITSLVQSAIESTPDGGRVWVAVSRTVDVEPPSEELGSAESYVCIEVGSGELVEHRGRLFESYASSEEVGGGNGLGLSLAHGIARDHEGWIEVGEGNGEPDGAAFRVLLPAE